MDKKASNKFLNTSSTGSATGNPRNKCSLKPGHSLMDWIRLGNSGADLSGTKGVLSPVSREELAKHNKENDAWLAIRGEVYNVTRYMEFHPGGVEELMRGAGTDATKLFNEIHAWVNYSQLLNKCRIGPLTNTVKIDAEIAKSLSLPYKKLFVQLPRLIEPDQVVPRFDWIQKCDNITLYFYTKQLCNPGSLIRYIKNDGRSIEIWIFIGSWVHKFVFELQGRIKWPPKKVQISTESGKIEAVLNKHDEHINLWSDLGSYTTTKILAAEQELETPLEFKMLSKSKFNNDSFVVLLKNESVVYTLPVGYHITLEDFVNDEKLNKCYTPVPTNYVQKYIDAEVEMECIQFLIKSYPKPNSFSQYLCHLDMNATMKVSLPKGNLNLSTLAAHKKFCFLAAGSGLTPFLSLINHLLSRNFNRIEFLKLIYFNKTENDIWCNEILTNLSGVDSRFKFVNILSNANDSWNGLKGRVNADILYPVVNKSMESISYIVACGPSNFITSLKAILNDLNFPNENLFIF